MDGPLAPRRAAGRPGAGAVHPALDGAALNGARGPIRAVRPGDATAVAGLLGELGYPAEPDAVRRRLERMLPDPAVTIRVAERDGVVVGLASLHLVPVLHEDAPRGQITALVVGEAARGGGVGRALVREIERIAAARGVRRLVVTTANHREGAHRFYETLGYDWTGRRYARALEPAPPEETR